MENEEQNFLLAWNSSGTAMTATEIAIRQREEFARLHMAQAKFVNEVERRIADAMGLTTARYPQITIGLIGMVYDLLIAKGYDSKHVRLVIPEADFLALYDTYSRKLDDNVSSMRISGIEMPTRHE